MKKTAKGVLLPLVLLLSTLTWAQNKTVTGKISGENEGVLAGASVTVKNTTIGVTTNEKGEFTISAPASAKTLVISTIGYDTREVAIGDGSIELSLKKSASSLEEVVVVGYGTQR